MHAELPTATLRAAVDDAASLPLKSDPRQILRNLLIEVSADGIEVTATDTLVGARLKIPVGDAVKVGTPGKATVIAATMKDIMRAANKNGTAKFLVEKHSFRIEIGSSKFKLPMEDPNDFPSIPHFSASKPCVQMRGKDFGALADRVTHCAHTEQSHFNMHGTNIEITNDTIRLVATNAQRLGFASAKIAPGAAAITSNIPAASLGRLGFFFEGDALIDLQFQQTALYARGPKGEVFIRGLSGAFPPYARGIPTNPLHLVFNRKLLIAALEQAVVIKQTGTAFVDLSLGPEGMVIEARADSAGETRVETPATWPHPPVTLCVHPGYVLESAKSMKSENVVMEIKDEMTPLVLREQTEGIDCFYVYAVAMR